MRFVFGLIIGISAALVTLCGGCKKEICKDVAPKLAYDTSYFEIKNSEKIIYIKYQFEDCQGDIGADPNDTVRTVYTFFYEFYDNEWHRFYHPDTADSVLFFAVIPGSEKVNTDQPVEGTIIQNFQNIKQNSDIIRFETYIFDRAGNRSNRVTTPRIEIP